MKSSLGPLILYLATSAVAFGGFHLGQRLLKPCPHEGVHIYDKYASAVANWDGQWYSEIAGNGYALAGMDYSSVAFFPAYPLLGRAIMRVTGLGADVALSLASNALFLAALYLLAAYVRRRYDDSDASLEGFAVLAVAAVPTSFFFRAAYSESLFLFVVILFLTAMQRRWSLPLVAAIVGLATAIRPVGIALIPPLLLYAWESSGGMSKRAANLALALPLSVWGIACYAFYLHREFGDTLAFSHAQAAWNRHGETSLVTRTLELISLEPIWSMFQPESIAYWYKRDIHHSFAFSLRTYDSGFFLAVAALTTLGYSKGWLSRRETLLAAGLLLVPYATNGYATYMNSMGRYTTVVVPVYLVVARLLRALPPTYAGALVGVSSFFLAAYAALFAAWYVVI
jgi:hypothetical protein